MKIFNRVSDLVGNTPMVKLSRYMLKENLNNNVFAKLEFFNPLGSIKDRIALAMIEDAEEKRLLRDKATIVEPTSGNTGIGLAAIGASRGYNVVLTMPENMSTNRRKILSLLGAKIELTPANLGMTGAINKAEEILKEKKGAFMPRQFDNMVNPYIHEKTTACEILNDMNKNIDFFVAGVGTGGTITGIGKALKKYNKETKVIAVEPEESAVLSGGKAGIHGIQGIGAGFIPKVLDKNVIDKIVTVNTNEAEKTADILATTEGLMVGISSGAALCAVCKMIKMDKIKNKNIVVIFPDTGERYL